jgi:hypothetical protein
MDDYFFAINNMAMMKPEDISLSQDSIGIRPRAGGGKKSTNDNNENRKQTPWGSINPPSPTAGSRNYPMEQSPKRSPPHHHQHSSSSVMGHRVATSAYPYPPYPPSSAAPQHHPPPLYFPPAVDPSSYYGYILPSSDEFYSHPSPSSSCPVSGPSSSSVNTLPPYHSAYSIPHGAPYHYPPPAHPYYQHPPPPYGQHPYYYHPSLPPPLYHYHPQSSIPSSASPAGVTDEECEDSAVGYGSVAGPGVGALFSHLPLPSRYPPPPATALVGQYIDPYLIAAATSSASPDSSTSLFSVHTPPPYRHSLEGGLFPEDD